MDINAIAKLAQLDFTDEEKAMMKKDLPSIVSYIDRLRAVDTTHVDAKEYIFEMDARLRDDVPREDLDEERKAVIANFPKKMGDALEVPVILS
jgi:aspartyl-tRNA(Asn)/glutamyl-tRNA(Gln) amidotransferase subunit C